MTTWRTAERLAVCVGPAPSSADIVRAARRTAAGLQAPWIALHVERTEVAPPGDADRERIEAHLRLADSLGGEVVRLRANGVADAILDFCRKRNVTRILVGKSTHPRLRDRLRGSLLDALVRGSGDIEVTALSGDRIDGAEPRALPAPPQPIPWEPYAKALRIVALATGAALGVRALFAAPDVEMLYLLAMMISGILYGRGPSLVAAAAAVASYDFFIVPPALTFGVSDTRYVLTFAMMFGVGWAMSELSSRLRRQGAASRFREARTRALFELTRDLASVLSPAEIAEVAARHAAVAFETGAVVLLPSAEGTLERAGSAPDGTVLGPTELGVARWVFAHGRPGGRGTDTIPGASVVAVPIAGAIASAGVLALAQQGGAPLDLEQRGFLEAIARQAALALERERLAAAAREADRRASAEELRSTLLSSVSHDLRTPLAAIVGAVTTVRDEPALPEATRREMLDTIVEEAGRLERLVSDLLDMTRLEAGAVALRREWVPVEEVVGPALERLAPRGAGAGVDVGATVAPDLPLVPLDPVLAEQMLINLLENASRHAASGGRIDLAVRRDGESLVIDVADRGPGIAPGDEERIFERFRRGLGATAGGSGLGLPIARAIARAHGGDLVAKAREGGGAIFRVTLPITGDPPPTSSGAETS